MNDQPHDPPRMSVATYVENHRILVSRWFAIVFFGVVLGMESRLEATVVPTVLFIAGLALVGVATVGRLWCSLYISGRKDDELISVGPYSITRNPLYFFSFLGFAGVGLATETLTLAAAMVTFFAIVYPVIIRREERFLKERFGRTYVDYCARVPRFFPNPSRYSEPDAWVVDSRRFRRTMVVVVWFVWLVALIELVEAVHELGIVAPWFRLP